MATRSPAAPAARAAPPIERHRLANGLRVVLAPDPRRSVVGVGVHYAAGFRADPPPHAGLAHLVEHLMFTGSAGVAATEHATRILAAGGALNATTRPDHAVYHQVVPAAAAELALFLEADRMASPRITEENLAAQVAVVKDEIALSVSNQPYGGFPWLSLPPVMFGDFPHAHNGYGEPGRLDAITVADVLDFLDRHYSPANAVLTVVGGASPDALRSMVERHFGAVPPGRAPDPGPPAEPPPAGERRRVGYDPFAAEPALAVGWRTPDPATAPEEYLAWVLLADLLADGPASRLHHRLVRRDRVATAVSGYLGAFGEPFAVRDPVLLQVEVYHAAEVPGGHVLGLLDEEIDRLATAGPAGDELERARVKAATVLLRSYDQTLERTVALGALELHHGDATLADALPGRLLGVPPGHVRSAARHLAAAPRAVLELRPGDPR